METRPVLRNQATAGTEAAVAKTLQKPESLSFPQLSGNSVKFHFLL